MDRRWKYDGAVSEYFVETETKAIVRQSELTKIREVMEREQEAAELHPIHMPTRTFKCVRC